LIVWVIDVDEVVCGEEEAEAEEVDDEGLVVSL
jgi:hypothetical protein